MPRDPVVRFGAVHSFTGQWHKNSLSVEFVIEEFPGTWQGREGFVSNTR